MGDPTQIHQVIMNLCTNAGYAMQDEGGRLDVSLLEMELDEESTANVPNLLTGPYLKLTVSDTGPGIPAHLLDRIFEPFFTTKQMGEGTGMGLAVAHGIVTAQAIKLRIIKIRGKWCVGAASSCEPFYTE
jgi:signal transduction histidine kinase